MSGLSPFLPSRWPPCFPVVRKTIADQGRLIKRQCCTAKAKVSKTYALLSFFLTFQFEHFSVTLALPNQMASIYRLFDFLLWISIRAAKGGVVPRESQVELKAHGQEGSGKEFWQSRSGVEAGLKSGCKGPRLIALPRWTLLDPVPSFSRSVLTSLEGSGKPR